MKRYTAHLLLALLLACGTMMSCDKDEFNTPTNGTEAAETQAAEEVLFADYDQDDSQQGFTIYGKKYYYKGNSFADQYTSYSQGDVLLLTVTNETDIDYKARVKITYLDENGEKIKTQSKAFSQFIAGYKNYFAFQPEEEYASYTCDLTLIKLNEEEKADIIVDKMKFTFNGLSEKIMTDMERLYSEGVWAEVPTIMAETLLTFNEGVPRKSVLGLLVLFDNTGEIYFIDECGRNTHLLGDVFWSETDTDHYVYFDREHRSKAEWPEELKGELTALMFPTEIKEIPEMVMPPMTDGES